VHTNPDRQVLRVGFWASLLALMGALGYILSALLQVLGVLDDFQDAVLAFGSSLLMPAPFLLAMLALHATAPPNRRFWSLAAIAFAVVYTTYNTLNYAVQLLTVLPAGYTWSLANQAGTQGPLTLLNQTPHSLFWDIDGLGYIFLNLATLFAAPLFARVGQERWIRRAFLVNALITPLFAITYFAPGYSVPVLLLGGLPWSIAVPTCLLLLALHFRRRIATVRLTSPPEPAGVVGGRSVAPGPAIAVEG
jgi:hypothetical protein